MVDKYIDEEKPWEVQDEEKKREIFGNLIYSLSSIANLIEPFLPQTSEKMRVQLGAVDGLYNIKKGEGLFPRI